MFEEKQLYSLKMCIGKPFENLKYVGKNSCRYYVFEQANSKDSARFMLVSYEGYRIEPTGGYVWMNASDAFFAQVYKITTLKTLDINGIPFNEWKLTKENKA